MKKILLVLLLLLSFIDSYCSDKTGLIEKYRISCDKMVVGDTISYIPLKNERNNKMITKFGDEIKQYVITKIDKKWEKKKKHTFRANWTIQEVGTDKRESIVVFYGNEEVLRKEYTSYFWDDEACNYDLPFFRNYEQWKNEIIGVVYKNPLIKATYEVVDASIKIDQLVTVVNSIDKRRHTYNLKTALDDCFKEDLFGSYETSLIKVEKPENPEIQYGEIKVITDSLNKYTYSDNFIDIVIFCYNSEFRFNMKNNTQHTLKVLWDDASFVDIDGLTSKIMHNGVKYSERENVQAPSTIIRGASLDEVAIPTRNVYYSETFNKWEVRPMYSKKPSNKTKQVILMLPIQIKGVTNEYLFIFDIKYEFKHPERINYDYWYSLNN